MARAIVGLIIAVGLSLLWMAPVSAYTAGCVGHVAAMDTAYANADGDLVLWSVYPSGADYTVVDETTPNDGTDYWYASFTNKTGFVDLSVDTSFQLFDSVRIVARVNNIDPNDVEPLQVLYDTSGVDVILDTFSVGTESGWLTFTSAPITGLTKAHLAGMEIGLKTTVSLSEETIRCSWLVLEMFVKVNGTVSSGCVTYHDTADMALGVMSSSESYDDRWTGAALTAVGGESGDDLRMMLALRDVAHLPTYLAGVDSQYVDSAFLYIDVSAAPTSYAGYTEVRILLPQGTENSGYAVQWNTKDQDTARSHTYWEYWYAPDTVTGTPTTADRVAWNSPGAGTEAASPGDWISSVIDTFRVTAVGIHKIDVTLWVQWLSMMDTTSRHGCNGLLFRNPEAEDSASGSRYISVGNMQPPASTDSTWLVIFYHTTTAPGTITACDPKLGYFSVTPFASTYTLEDYYRGLRDSATANGTADSISVWLDFPVTSDSNYTWVFRGALYRFINPVCTLYAATIAETINVVSGVPQVDRWVSLEFDAPKPSIYSTHTYLITAWAQAQGGAILYVRRGAASHVPPWQVYLRNETYGTSGTFLSTWTLSSYANTCMDIQMCYTASGSPPTGPPFGTLMMMGIGRSLPQHPFAERVRNYLNQEDE